MRDTRSNKLKKNAGIKLTGSSDISEDILSHICYHLRVRYRTHGPAICAPTVMFVFVALMAGFHKFFIRFAIIFAFQKYIMCFWAFGGYG